MKFPEIEGMTWLSEEFPDLVSIKVVMENRAQALMDIPGLKPEETLLDQYVDLGLLAGVRDWYEKGADEPSETECQVDFNGINQMVFYIKKKDLLAAWMFYKQFYKK